MIKLIVYSTLVMAFFRTSDAFYIFTITAAIYIAQVLLRITFDSRDISSEFKTEYERNVYKKYRRTFNQPNISYTQAQTLYTIVGVSIAWTIIALIKVQYLMIPAFIVIHLASRIIANRLNPLLFRLPGAKRPPVTAARIAKGKDLDSWAFEDVFREKHPDLIR